MRITKGEFNRLRVLGKAATEVFHLPAVFGDRLYFAGHLSRTEVREEWRKLRPELQGRRIVFRLCGGQPDEESYEPSWFGRKEEV